MQSKHGDAPDEQLPDDLVDATLFSSWKSLRGMDKPMAVELWLRESAKEQGLTDDTIGNNVDEAKTAAETNAAAEANIAAEANVAAEANPAAGETSYSKSSAVETHPDPLRLCVIALHWIGVARLPLIRYGLYKQNTLGDAPSLPSVGKNRLL